jgi:hypothetical protein
MRKRRCVDLLGVGSLSMVLMAGCWGAAQPDEVARAGTALAADVSATFAVTLPVGSGPPMVLAGASGALKLDDGVTLTDPSGRTVIAGAGVAIGVGAVVGDKPSKTIVNLVSTGPVTLADRAEVTGTVWAPSAPSLQSGAVIDGKVTVAGAAFLAGRTWKVTFPGANQGDVDLEPGKQRTLVPGAYGNVTVKSRATLTLGAGTYTFASLDLEAQSAIQSNTSGAPLVVYVKDTLVLHGSVAPSGGASTFLLGYAGSSLLTIDAAFSGTLVAPSASVTLGALNAPARHQGAFFAQALEIRSRTQVAHAPFARWSSAIPLAGSAQSVPALALGAAQPPPPLDGAGDVPTFLTWAYQARPSQVDAGRAIILGASRNEGVAAAIVAALGNDGDLGRILVGMSVLGELRTQAGMQYFLSVLATPLPTTGTVVGEQGTGPGGVPAEQITLAKLQARAVDGLSLMLSTDADTAVRNVISTTTSNLVRSRAIHDYLFVHGAAGRATLAALLAPDQQIFLDRIDVSSATAPYNTRLAAYLAKHPEVVSPASGN